jgi:glycine/D-amino acid oxidase-like deaminating enzyme
MKYEVFWYGGREITRMARLEGAHDAEVVVVGGGTAGLMCLEALHERNVSTLLVERDFCGSGASGKNSGFITPASEIDLHSLCESHGPQEARRIWEFACSGVEALRTTIHSKSIACDHEVQDSLFVANDEGGMRVARSEHDARRSLGYESRLYGADDIGELLATSRFRGGVRHGGSFAIDPYAFCRGLRDRLVNGGARVFEDSPVTHVDGSGVTTLHGHVRARHVIVCCDRFTPALGAWRGDIHHVQTYLGVSQPMDSDQRRTLCRDGPLLTWDSDLVYNYFRPLGTDRILLGGGDLSTTYRNRPAARLAGHARRLASRFHANFPRIEFDLECVWSGMLGVSKDLLPLMQADARHANVWIAGAATGLPWAAALGVYAAERLLDGRDDFDRTFSPARRQVIGRRVQALLSTPLTFALSHAVAKYAPKLLRAARERSART